MIKIIKLICLLLNIHISLSFGWGCHKELLPKIETIFCVTQFQSSERSEIKTTYGDSLNWSASVYYWIFGVKSKDGWTTNLLWNLNQERPFCLFSEKASCRPCWYLKTYIYKSFFWTQPVSAKICIASGSNGVDTFYGCHLLETIIKAIWMYYLSHLLFDCS